MVNPLRHWLRVPFETIFWIPLRGLSSFWGTGLWIPLSVLSGFLVNTGLLVPAHPLLVPVFSSFEFSMSFFVGLQYLGCIVLCCQIGRSFVT